MKKLFFFIILLMPILNLNAQTISGKITDSVSHETIIGAVIYIPQLKLGATSDTDGYYKIDQLPNGTFDIETEYLGYNTAIKHITIAGNMTVNFALNTATSQEIVVTALGNQTTIKRSPVPITLISHDMLLQGTSSNIVDAISMQPGMSEITTGPGVSKPEINGLGYNRVLTLMDGARQEDFQWGDEHGILIDPYAVYNAEIIRGAASLQYGANAMAGVVSFKSQPFAESGAIQGSILTEYQTNNGLIGTSANVGGNHNGFVWDVRGSNEEAHCYWNPKDGYVWGTAYASSNARIVLGLNKKWGYSHLTVSLLHRQVEIPDGYRDSATGQFLFDAPINGQLAPNRNNYMSYNPNIAGYQILDHNVALWQNSINAGTGKIGVDIGFTQSVRHEIDSSNVGFLNMAVNDIPYSLKYQVEGFNSGLKLTTGFNGMYEFMKNGIEPPAPFVGDFEIPDYHLFDIGGYAILEKDYKNLTLSGGLRYDVRTLTGQSMYLSGYGTPAQAQVSAGTTGAYTQFSPFNHSYSGYSGSVGASYQLPEHNYVKLNVAKSFRAPAINELTANQLDPANVFKLGDASLKAEEGYEIDAAFGNNGRDISFEIDGFYNLINNFIFADRFANTKGSDSMRLGAPVYRYGANTAIISGISGYFNIHPMDTKWIEINNGFTYINTFLPGQSDSTRHLPFTPAPRLTTDVRFKLSDKRTSILRETYIEIGMAKYWAQKNIYSALWNELPSEAYTLYHVGIGTNFVNPRTKRVLCSMFINCTNMLNLAYADHTSREQYFLAYNSALNPGVNGGNSTVVTQPTQGIYNMGRNIGIKLMCPIGGHKVSNAELHGVQ